MNDQDWTPEEEEAFNAIEKQSNLGKQILQDMKLVDTPTHIRLDKHQISRLMRDSGLSAPYASVKEFVRLLEAKLKDKDVPKQ